MSVSRIAKTASGISVEHRRWCSFKKNLFEHRDVIAGWQDARDVLEDNGHLVNGK
jgi:hypothetical protein